MQQYDWGRSRQRDAVVFRNLAIRVSRDDPRVGVDPDSMVVAPGRPVPASFPVFACGSTAMPSPPSSSRW
ncbi:MAG TPA: hypothetical protein VHU80_09920 [Polyangiaceae bacterium]|nr:hypothetical protein [Polyangiaceae bacterium]